jgi:putative transposase
MNASTNPYAGHRYPAEIISHAVWLYFRFTLSFRDIEELLTARGIVVTYEAARQWFRKFGQQYAKKIRRRRPVYGELLFKPRSAVGIARDNACANGIDDDQLY